MVFHTGLPPFTGYSQLYAILILCMQRIGNKVQSTVLWFASPYIHPVTVPSISSSMQPAYSLLVLMYSW